MNYNKYRRVDKRKMYNKKRKYTKHYFKASYKIKDIIESDNEYQIIEYVKYINKSKCNDKYNLVQKRRIKNYKYPWNKHILTKSFIKTKLYNVMIKDGFKFDNNSKYLQILQKSSDWSNKYVDIRDDYCIVRFYKNKIPLYNIKICVNLNYDEIDWDEWQKSIDKYMIELFGNRYIKEWV